MKIYNICDNLSISVVKHVQLQKMLGHETIVCYNQTGIPRFASSRCGILFSPPNVQTLHSFCTWADVVMIHTSVSSVKLLEIETEKPIVWACHDYKPEAQEYYGRIAACVVPSNGYKKWIDKSDKFPVAVIQRKVYSKDWPNWQKDRINCTLMCGMVSNLPSMPYRSYKAAVSALQGRMIVQSCQRPSMMHSEYMCLETVEPDQMLERLAMFDTAWCGSGNEDIHFDDIVNNKFHESIASGCVPLVWKAKEMKDYSELHGCGIIWNGVYPSQHQLIQCRKQILRRQSIHFLENEAPLLKAVLSYVRKDAR